MSVRSAIGSSQTSPRQEKEAERTRPVRQAPSTTATPYELISTLKRPDHGTRGKRITLLVNWFKIQYPEMTKMYVYKVAVREEQRQNRGRRGPSKEPEPAPEIKNKSTKSKIFWNTIREYRTLFPNIHRVLFDDFHFVFTPDRVPMNNESEGLWLFTQHPSKRGARVSVHFSCLVTFFLDLTTPDDIDANHDAWWTVLFLKNLMSQKSRFVPADNASAREIDFSKRFANFGGGMFIIPRFETIPQSSFDLTLDIDHDFEVGKPIDVQPGVEAWLGIYASVRRMENFHPLINMNLYNKLFIKPRLDLVTFYLLILEDPMSRNLTLPELRRNSCMIPEAVADFNRRLSGVKLKCECVPAKKKFGRHDLVFGKVERHYQFVELNNRTCADLEELLVEDRNGREFEEIETRDGRVFTKRFRIERMEKWYASQGKPIKYPYLPLCVVKSGKTSDLIPMEVLLTDDKPETYKGLLNFWARLTLTRKQVRPPAVQYDLTNKIITDKLQYGDDEFLREMNVSFNPNMIECEGRVLRPCAVMGKSDSDDSVKRLDVREDTGDFYLPRAVMTSPKIIRFVPFILTDAVTREQVFEFYRELVKKCVSRGMNVPRKDYVEPPKWYTAKIEQFPDGRRDFKKIASMIENLKGVFAKYERKTDDELPVILFITKMANELYGGIKYLCDIQYEVVSQVIDAQTVIAATIKSEKEMKEMKEESDRSASSRHDFPYDQKSIYHHICLKLNAKLGGVNQIVEPEDDEPEYGRMPSNERTMFIGIDVTHPSPKAALKDCSVASIVASMDKNAAKYAVRLKVNTRCNENVSLFDEHFSALLAKYIKVNTAPAGNNYPERIVIIRDGVSDSQMKEVASQELHSIKHAWAVCAEKDVECPPITYIVAQKRHQTRFYHKEDGVVKNAPMGTTVDKDIVTPHTFDFYMTPHFAQIGTARPIHYTVLYDECYSSADVIQELLYRLCFLYARCSKPVSLPAPVYYAHLACERAALHHQYSISAGIVDEIRDKQSSENDDQYSERVARQALNIEKNLQVSDKYPGMYFI